METGVVERILQLKTLLRGGPEEDREESWHGAWGLSIREERLGGGAEEGLGEKASQPSTEGQMREMLEKVEGCGVGRGEDW